MISSKFNFIVSAAILASTVYLLWIKIKRKSSSHPKKGSDSEICKKNDTEEFVRLESESLENYADSNFIATQDIEIINNKGKLENILETKCSLLNIGDLKEDFKIHGCSKLNYDGEINGCGKEETLHALELSLTNMSPEIKLDLDNSILEISNNKEELSVISTEICNKIINKEEMLQSTKLNTGDHLIDEKNNDYYECSTVVDGLSNENQVNISLEDGEIIEESMEDVINETEIVVKEMASLLINNIVETITNNEIFFTEIEDGEIVEESLVGNKFEGIITNSENINNNFLSENYLTIEKDFEQIETLTQSVIKNDSEISICNELHVEDGIQGGCIETLEEIEEGEIIEESFKQNEVGDSIYQKEEIIKDEFDLLLINIKENMDTINTSDHEKRNNIQSEFITENNYTHTAIELKEKEDKCLEDLSKEIVIENDKLCTIEILEICKCNEKYEESIKDNDNSTEKVEEFIDKKEEFIDELILIKNSNQNSKEDDYFYSSETSTEKDSLIKSNAADVNDEISNEIVDSNDLTDNVKDTCFGNGVEYSNIESTETPGNLLKYGSNDADSTSDISQNSDYFDDAPLDNFMDYIEECLNGNESKNDENCKLENWPNDEDSLNNIKRDFYEISTAICSPHPSSESDHAHCVNNLTERVAILSAESILDNQCQTNSSDSEMTPTLSSPTLDDSNPELYVEKITYDGKELDVVYFEEALLEEGGIQSDIKIIRTIPVGLGGRIIGKKGKTKNELLKKYGAQLLIYNHPTELGKQVLEITCCPSVSGQLEDWVNKTLDQITKNTIQTTVSNPEWLKPMIPLGRLVAAHVVDMPTIPYVKIRIFDQQVIKAFNKMQNEMNLDYSRADNTSLLPRPVAAGCVCVAMVRPDYFLRAQIVEMYEDFAWVYLFDLGKVCQTYLCYLFKIREKYMRVPFQVIPARMPHALTKNKSISPAVIYKRFLCDPITNKPKMVRVFFPRMSTCCEPCVNIYIPMSVVSDNGSSNEEFVDLLELLVSIDVCSMVRETVNSEFQVKINTSHFKAFLNGKDKRQPANSNVPVYFQPCNSKFYDDFIEFKSDNETN